MNTPASSQIFDGKRFLAVMRRDWRLERNSWAIRILAMFGVLLMVELFAAWLSVATNGFYEECYPVIKYTCWFMLSLFACLGASQFHSGYATAGGRLNELMNPASTLEKFCSRLIFCVVGVPLVYAACWEIADWVRVFVLDSYFNVSTTKHVSILDAGNMIFERHNIILSWFSLASSQAAYVLGSTIWPKNSFIKTLGAMAVVQFIYGFAAGYVSSTLFHGRTVDVPVVDFQAIADIFINTVTIASIVSALFCYIVAYFRMREDEIIQRM